MAIWHQNVDILYGITISCTDSPVRLNMTHPFGWVLYLLKRGPMLWGGHFPTFAAYNGQWLIGQKITDHFIWGLLLAFQQGKKSRSTSLLPIHSLVLHTCKALEAAVYHPINPIQLKGSSFCAGRLPLPLLQCLSSALLPTAGEKADLTASLFRLNHLKSFVHNQTKIALHWLHSVIC